ncbi:Mce protein [Mycobacterium sp. E342]|uniref:Mce protein n=1 Tax=unclassified Mycobacterium TaxID=2642494 RepID=UPI0007FC6B38|nr:MULTISPECIES: Mce protein [unclassified Mycobacterium]OBH18319.1 Mce protein [Mycobacterium sp. E3247]OBH22979.1 Mce protein [Mycobacterium sp. E342]
MAKHADAAQDELSATDRPSMSAATPGQSDGDSTQSPNRITSKDDNAAAAPASDESDAADDYDTAVDEDADDASEDAAPPKKRATPVRLAAALGLVTVVALGAVAGWFGYRGYQARQAQQQRELLVQVGRQGALNLTTIDWHHADADVQRILDSATGQFYDDFSQRSKPFVDVVKKAQSTSVGTITDAGLESQSGDEAQVLVAVSVKTSNAGAAEQDPRHWRMRITVQKVGGGAKVSNVGFVP